MWSDQPFGNAVGRADAKAGQTIHIHDHYGQEGVDQDGEEFDEEKCGWNGDSQNLLLKYKKNC